MLHVIDIWPDRWPDGACPFATGGVARPSPLGDEGAGRSGDDGCPNREDPRAVRPVVPQCCGRQTRVAKSVDQASPVVRYHRSMASTFGPELSLMDSEEQRRRYPEARITDLDAHPRIRAMIERLLEADRADFGDDLATV